MSCLGLYKYQGIYIALSAQDREVMRHGSTSSFELMASERWQPHGT